MNISKVIDYFIPKKHLENAELYRKSQFIVWLFFVFVCLFDQKWTFFGIVFKFLY